MGTYLALRQTDSFHELLDGIELQCSQSKLVGNLIHHSLIFRRTCGSILLQILVGIALKLLDDSAGNQLHITLGRSKVDERTAINQWRTSDTHVTLLQTSLIEEHLHIVAKLGTAHDTVIAEQHTLTLQHSLVRNQLHLGYQRAHALVARCKASRPGRSIFGNTTLIRHALTGSISHRHTCTRIRNTAAAIYLYIICLGKIEAIGKASFLYILALVGRSWESIIYPEERTNLHLLVGRTDLLHTLSSNLHDFARTYLVCCLEVKVRE